MQCQVSSGDGSCVLLGLLENVLSGVYSQGALTCDGMENPGAHMQQDRMQLSYGHTVSTVCLPLCVDPSPSPLSTTRHNR